MTRTTDLDAQLTQHGWRRLASGNWTHPHLPATPGTTSRARILTTQQAIERQTAWDTTRDSIVEAAERILKEHAYQTPPRTNHQVCRECGDRIVDCECPASIRATRSRTP